MRIDPVSESPAGNLPPHRPTISGWKRPLVRWGVAAALILFGAFCYWYSLKHPNTTSTTNTKSDRTLPSHDVRAVPNTGRPATPTTTVESSGAFKLEKKSADFCTADAPADWTITSNKQSNAADLYGPNKTMYAGWGAQAVITAIAPYASAEPAPLNDPDLYSSDPATVTKGYAKIIVGQLGGSADLAYTSDINQTVGDYTLRSIASSTHKGVVFYRTQGYPSTDGGYSYALPMRWAFTTNQLWDSEGLLAARVAASIDCTIQLVPHQGPIYEPSSSASSSTAPTDENGSDAGYNPQLGTEYVHDSATGDNYLVDPSTNWSSDGPEGAGYYKQNGNDYTLLTPGRSE